MSESSVPPAMAAESVTESGARIKPRRVDALQTARAVTSVGGTRAVSASRAKDAKESEPRGAEEEGDEFLRRMTKWSDRSRKDWSWGHRPGHRNLTVGAAMKQQSLVEKNAADLSSLEEVEASMLAMHTYIASRQEGSAAPRSPEAVTNNMDGDMGDLLRISEQAKARAKEQLAIKLRDSNREVTSTELPSELVTALDTHRSSRASSRPSSASHLRPIKPFDPDMLESVKRHNAFRQKMALMRNKSLACDKQAAEFHALPMPDYHYDIKEINIAQHQVKNASYAERTFFVTEGDGADAEDDSDSENELTEKPLEGSKQITPGKAEAPSVKQNSGSQKQQRRNSESNEDEDDQDINLLDLDQKERQVFM
jgi:hypothetical protein